MLSELTIKDWIAIIPAWIGMITGVTSWYYFLRREKREASARRPSISATLEMQVKDRIWLVRLQMQNNTSHLVKFDIVRILSPEGMTLFAHVPSGGLSEAIEKPGAVQVRIEQVGETPAGGAASWVGYLRAEQGLAPTCVQFGVEVVVISDRERRSTLKTTRSTST